MRERPGLGGGEGEGAGKFGEKGGVNGIDLIETWEKFIS